MNTTTFPATYEPVTNPDKHLLRVLCNASQVIGTRPSPDHCAACVMWHDLAYLVLALDAYLAAGGCLPTTWASGEPQRPVADVPLPRTPDGGRDAAWWEARAVDLAGALDEAAMSLSASLEGYCEDCRRAQARAPGDPETARCDGHATVAALLDRYGALADELQRTAP